MMRDAFLGPPPRADCDDDAVSSSDERVRRHAAARSRHSRIRREPLTATGRRRPSACRLQPIDSCPQLRHRSDRRCGSKCRTVSWPRRPQITRCTRCSIQVMVSLPAGWRGATRADNQHQGARWRANTVVERHRSPDESASKPRSPCRLSLHCQCHVADFLIPGVPWLEPEPCWNSGGGEDHRSINRGRGAGAGPRVDQAGIFTEQFAGLTTAFVGFGRGGSAPSYVRAYVPSGLTHRNLVSTSVSSAR